MSIEKYNIEQLREKEKGREMASTLIQILKPRSHVYGRLSGSMSTNHSLAYMNVLLAGESSAHVDTSVHVHALSGLFNSFVRMVTR